MLKSGDVLRLDQIDLETVKKKKNFKKINIEFCSQISKQNT